MFVHVQTCAHICKPYGMLPKVVCKVEIRQLPAKYMKQKYFTHGPCFPDEVPLRPAGGLEPLCHLDGERLICFPSTTAFDWTDMKHNVTSKKQHLVIHPIDSKDVWKNGLDMNI